MANSSLRYTNPMDYYKDIISDDDDESIRRTESESLPKRSINEALAQRRTDELVATAPILAEEEGDFKRFAGPLVKTAMQEGRPVDKDLQTRITNLTTQLREKEGPIKVAGYDLLDTAESVGVAAGLREFQKFWVDNIMGLAETVATGAETIIGADIFPTEESALDKSIIDFFGGLSSKTKRKGRFGRKQAEKYYTKLRKEGTGSVWAGISTAYKIFKEAPETKTGGEFMTAYINNLVDETAKISKSEGAALTAYWRPEASFEEQALRAVPEAVTFMKASMMFALRKGPKIVKQLQKEYDDILRGRGEKTKDILKADEADLATAIQAVSKNTNYKLLQNMRRRGLEQRSLTHIRLKQKPGKIKDLQNEIRNARLSIKKSKKNKRVLKEERKRLRRLQTERWTGTTPQLIREIQLTEAGVLAGSVAIGNYLGEDYSVFGAFGGGLFAGIGYNSIKSAITNAPVIGKGISAIGESLGILSSANMKALIRDGKLPSLAGFSKRDKAHLENLSIFIQGLPPNQREKIINNLMFFNTLRKDLTDLGIDGRLLDETIGKATGLVPLMLMRESITANSIDLSRRSPFSKFSKEISDYISQHSDSIDMIADFRRTLTELSTKARDAGYVDKDGALVDLVTNLQKVSDELVSETTKNKAAISSTIDEAIDYIMNASKNPGNGFTTENMNSYIHSIISSKFFNMGEGLLDEEMITEGTKEAGRIGASYNNIAFKVLEGIARRANSDVSIQRALADVISSDQYRVPVVDRYPSLGYDAYQDFSTILNWTEATLRTMGGKEFDKLKDLIDGDTRKPLQIDATNWLRSLYEFDSPKTRFKVEVPEKATTRARQAAARVKQIAGIRSLAETESIDSINLSIDETTEAGRNFKRLIHEILVNEEFKPDGRVIIDYDDVDINTIKQYLNGLGEGSFNNFSAFRWLDDIAQDFSNQGIRGPSIVLSMEDAVLLHREWSKQSRRFYRHDDRVTSARYRDLASSVADKLIGGEDAVRSTRVIDGNTGEEYTSTQVREMFDTARYNWLHNVHNRFYNENTNPLGYLVTKQSEVRSATDTFLGIQARNRAIRERNKILPKEDQIPEEKIPKKLYGTSHKTLRTVLKVDEFLNANSSSSDADEVVELLERTFGNWDDVAGKYVLDDQQKLAVANMMNNLYRNAIETNKLKLGIEEAQIATELRPTVRGALEDESMPSPQSLDISDINYAALGPDTLRDIIATRKAAVGGVHAPESVKYFKELNNPFADRLDELGFISKDHVNDAARNVENYLAKNNKTEELTKTLQTEIERVKAEAMAAINAREKVIRNVSSFMGLGKIDEAVSYENMFEIFISNPNSARYQERLIPELVETMNKSEEEIKKILSDIILEGLSRKTHSGIVLPEPGVAVKNFNHEDFLTLVTDNRTNIENITGSETYDGILKMAQFLSIKNNAHLKGAAENGMNIRVPRGLSVESYLSRAYGIMRGVISPRYVVTEVALLKLRKENAKSLANILAKPKAVDALIELMDQRGNIPKRYHSDLFTALVGALAADELRSEESEPIRKSVAPMAGGVAEQMSDLFGGAIN